MEKSINGEFFRGHIDTIILKMLYEGDRYGYDIIKEIEQKSEGRFKIKQATLYSCLRRLEEQGFLSSYWGEKTAGGRKKYYTLTQMGKEVFVRNQNDWQKSKDIIDNLVYGIDSVPDSNIYSPQNESNTQSFSNEDLNKLAQDLDDSIKDSDEENIDEGSIESLFFEGPFGGAKMPDQAQEELKDNFSRIFGSLRPEKSYVDNVVNQTYKPDEGKKGAAGSFNFFANEDEPPYRELPAKKQSDEPQEKDYNFLEPEPIKKQAECEESPIKAKAKQILIEAKAQAGIVTPPPTATSSKSEIEFIKYNSDDSERIVSDTEIINQEYQQALGKLIKNIKRQPQTEAINTHIQQEKKLESVRQETMLMGDSVTVRRHDNAVKQYNSENYFYKNKLMLVHYGIMFIFMLIQVAAAFAVCELTLKSGPISTVDLWVYISFVILALFFPIYAFLCSYKDFYKRKLREKSFKNSIVFRIIILLQLWVVISAVGVYRGILTDDIMDYLATFVVPAIFALNVLWSYIVYICLLKSNKFNV